MCMREFSKAVYRHGTARHGTARLMSFEQNRLFSCLMPNNVKITIYRTVILLVVLYGC